MHRHFPVYFRFAIFFPPRGSPIKVSPFQAHEFIFWSASSKKSEGQIRN